MSKRILVVDDNHDNLYMLKALLEGYGYRVTEATDGVSALEQARATLPDAVVTDMMMPGMDGFALCRSWMQDDRLWRIPFIVYTATYTEPKDRKLVLDLGADAYIIKPSEPEEVMGVVASVLARAKSKTESRPELHDGEFFERYASRLQGKLDRKIKQLADTKKRLVDYVARCEAILDVSPMAIVSIDDNHIIRAWNYAAECLFGYPEVEALGESFEMLIPEDRIDEANHSLAVVSKTKSVLQYETKRLHKEGYLLEISISLSFISPELGYIELISDQASISDASREKKKLEEQLVLAQRMESVGRLAGGVAHDFNNLLTVINAHAEFIENDLSEDTPTRENATRILEAGDRATSLTRQLLAFSRRQAMRTEVLQVNKVVGDMEKMLRRLIGEDVELRVKLSDNPGRIEADLSQLEQVIMNLAVNAKDAMPDGGRLLIDVKNAIVDREEAEAGPPMRPGRYVVLTVQDTGCGMDEETRAHAFDPFFTTKEQGKGTGLGLATVYGIVKQNNGFVSIHSEVGLGTTFRVYLQRVDKPLACRLPPTITTEVRGGGESILVVEDDEMVCALARRILERAGYRVFDAPNGPEGLRVAENCGVKIDLLLTDVIMPSMNGWELARRILDLRPETKVVFTSGYTDDAIAHHGVLSSGVTLIEKPFSSDSLMSIVRNVLDGNEPGGLGEALGQKI